MTSCPACTYLNEAAASVCSICATPLPLSQPSVSPSLLSSSLSTTLSNNDEPQAQTQTQTQKQKESSQKKWRMVYGRAVNARESPHLTANTTVQIQPMQILCELELHDNWLRHEYGWTIIATQGITILKPLFSLLQLRRQKVQQQYDRLNEYFQTQFRVGVLAGNEGKEGWQMTLTEDELFKFRARTASKQAQQMLNCSRPTPAPSTTATDSLKSSPNLKDENWTFIDLDFPPNGTSLFGCDRPEHVPVDCPTGWRRYARCLLPGTSNNPGQLIHPVDKPRSPGNPSNPGNLSTWMDAGLSVRQGSLGIIPQFSYLEYLEYIAYVSCHPS